jgi:hypothetical protein
MLFDFVKFVRFISEGNRLENYDRAHLEQVLLHIKDEAQNIPTNDVD